MTTRAALIRQATAAALVRAGTLAGPYVEEDRIDPVGENDGPRIVISTAVRMDGLAPAGSAPKFTVTETLMLVAIAFAPSRDEVRAALDTFESQILDALLTDPDWTRLASNPESIDIGRVYKQGDTIGAELHMHLKLGWKETYPPRLTTPLATVHATIHPPGHSTEASSILAQVALPILDQETES